MIRSSRRERPPLLSGTANSASSSASSSRSGSRITTLLLETNKRGGTLGHSLFPGVRGGKRWQPAALLLENRSTNRQLLCLIWRQGRALRGDYSLDLFQALFAHGLGEDRIGFAEWVDSV